MPIPLDRSWNVGRCSFWTPSMMSCTFPNFLFYTVVKGILCPSLYLETLCLTDITEGTRLASGIVDWLTLIGLPPPNHMISAQLLPVQPISHPEEGSGGKFCLPRSFSWHRRSRTGFFQSLLCSLEALLFPHIYPQVWVNLWLQMCLQISICMLKLTDALTGNFPWHNCASDI